VPDEKPPIDRALDLFVYAPVGVALYVRDMLPSMMGIFVSRGKREVKSHLGLSEPPPPVAPPQVADIRRRMDEGMDLARGVAEGGFGLARDIAGTALQGLLAFREAMPEPPSGAVADADPEVAPPLRSVPTERADTTSAATATATASRPATEPATPPDVPVSPAADAPAVESLPIPDYDELSASQVIERLEGLDRASLDAIRAYEAQHRARNTILGKIAQLG
jgi:hypothetical protein